MQNSTREQVLAEIDRFLRQTGMAKSRFGVEAVGNDFIIDQMRAGKNPRIDTIDKIRAYMREKRAERKARPKQRRGMSQPAA